MTPRTAEWPRRLDAARVRHALQTLSSQRSGGWPTNIWAAPAREAGPPLGQANCQPHGPAWLVGRADFCPWTSISIDPEPIAPET